MLLWNKKKKRKIDDDEEEEAAKKFKLNTKITNDCFHMLETIARVWTNYHHTTERTL
jgi:hypothetical protein